MCSPPVRGEFIRGAHFFRASDWRLNSNDCLNFALQEPTALAEVFTLAEARIPELRSSRQRRTSST
jgi:hypothetical protein